MISKTVSTAKVRIVSEIILKWRRNPQLFEYNFENMLVFNELIPDFKVVLKADGFRNSQPQTAGMAVFTFFVESLEYGVFVQRLVDSSVAYS